MASLSEYRGSRRVQFLVGRRRFTVWVGATRTTTLERAQKFRDHVATLVACLGHSETVPEKTLRWAIALPDRTYARLAEAKLVPPRAGQAATVTIGQLVADVKAEMAGFKPNTQRFYGVVCVMLLKRFPETMPVTAVGTKEADDCVAWMRGHLGPATAARRIKCLRKMFGRAVRWGWIQEGQNPFAGIKAGSSVNAARQEYVPLEVFEKVLAAETDLEFRAILALARLGALRTPSEILHLKWNAVRWEERKLLVYAPKTERSRELPLFPRLYEILLAWNAEAPPGDFVVSRFRGIAGREAEVNWRRRLERVIEKAGVKQWPKLFQNLRASRESELVSQYPLVDVCRWLGHRPEVAVSHYLMSIEHDRSFRHAAGLSADGAAHNAAQTGVDSKGQEGTRPDDEAMDSLESEQLAGCGAGTDCARRDSNTPGNAGELTGEKQDSAQCGAVADGIPVAIAPDGQLNEFAKIWQGLPAATRAALLAVARAADGT